jgi:hypothetical protein
MLGWLLVRLRFAVVLFWAMVALAAYLYLPPLGSNTTSNLSEVVPEAAPAAKAQSQAEDLSGPVEAPAILVYSNPEGLRRLIWAGYEGGPASEQRARAALPLAAGCATRRLRREHPCPSDESEGYTHAVDERTRIRLTKYSTKAG